MSSGGVCYLQTIVLVDEPKAGIKYRLELLREALVSKGFKLSTTKIEDMYYKFCNRRQTHSC